MKNKIKEKPHIKSYVLTVFKGEVVQRHDTSRWRRFLYQTRMIPWQKGQIKAYLKVNYKEDFFGKKIMFSNSGTYDNKKDFDLALKAFLEE